MPKNNFNKVSTLWRSQTYMENMSTVLKPEEISFGVLFFRQKNCQLRTFLKLLPLSLVFVFLKDNLMSISFHKVTVPKYMNIWFLNFFCFCLAFKKRHGNLSLENWMVEFCKKNLLCSKQIFCYQFYSRLNNGKPQIATLVLIIGREHSVELACN